MTVTGVADTLANLQRAAEAARRGARKAIVQEGEHVKEHSQGNAPVDLHNLENAHEVSSEADSNKIVVTVSVGGGEVDDYALAMHEGVYNLGAGSQAKQAGSDRMVGRKFLERALDEAAPEIERAVADAVRKAFGLELE